MPAESAAASKAAAVKRSATLYIYKLDRAQAPSETTERKQDKATTSEMQSTTAYDYLVKLLVIGDSGESFARETCPSHFDSLL